MTEFIKESTNKSRWVECVGAEFVSNELVTKMEEYFSHDDTLSIEAVVNIIHFIIHPRKVNEDDILFHLDVVKRKINDPRKMPHHPLANCISPETGLFKQNFKLFLTPEVTELYKDYHPTKWVHWRWHHVFCEKVDETNMFSYKWWVLVRAFGFPWKRQPLMKHLKELFTDFPFNPSRIDVKLCTEANFGPFCHDGYSDPFRIHSHIFDMVNYSRSKMISLHLAELLVKALKKEKKTIHDVKNLENAVKRRQDGSYANISQYIEFTLVEIIKNVNIGKIVKKDPYIACIEAGKAKVLKKDWYTLCQQESEIFAVKNGSIVE